MQNKKDWLHAHRTVSTVSLGDAQALSTHASSLGEQRFTTLTGSCRATARRLFFLCLAAKNPPANVMPHAVTPAPAQPPYTSYHTAPGKDTQQILHCELLTTNINTLPEKAVELWLLRVKLLPDNHARRPFSCIDSFRSQAHSSIPAMSPCLSRREVTPSPIAALTPASSPSAADSELRAGLPGFFWKLPEDDGAGEGEQSPAVTPSINAKATAPSMTRPPVNTFTKS